MDTGKIPEQVSDRGGERVDLERAPGAIQSRADRREMLIDLPRAVARYEDRERMPSGLHPFIRRLAAQLRPGQSEPERHVNSGREHAERGDEPKWAPPRRHLARGDQS